MARSDVGRGGPAQHKPGLLDVVGGDQLWTVFAQMALAAVAAAIVGPRIVIPHADFLALWAAHQVRAPYKVEEITRAAGGAWFYYPYPPTFLVLTLPFRWLAQLPAYAGWVALSAAAVGGAIRRPLGILVVFAPAVAISGLLGQTSLLVGALLFLGMVGLRDPRLSGVCLGLAACVKPQVGVLVPLALLANGEWRAIGWATLTGLVVAALATLVYGGAVWIDWAASLPRFLQDNDAHLATHYLSLPGAWRFVALGIGGACVWRAAQRGDRVMAGLIAVAAALLGSMHAMSYDQAVLAPFAFAAAIERRLFGLPFAAFLAAPLAMPAVLLAGGYACWTSELRPRKAPAPSGLT